MGKSSKAPKPENLGTGKITPIQVAFIVDRYLSDNNYTKTLAVFRNEASKLISKVREAPKSLLSLGAILDEYICLKEQKVILDQEKCRVEKLLQGMQDVMNAYNSAGRAAQIGVAATIPVPHMDPGNGSLGGYPIYSTPKANVIPMLPSTGPEHTNVSPSIASLPSTNKRKGSRAVADETLTAKRSCTELPVKVLGSGGTAAPPQAANTNANLETVQQFSVLQSKSHNHPSNGSSLPGSSIAKSLFRQTPQSQAASCPKTPPQELPSQVEKVVSPLETSSSNSNTVQEIALTNCHIISSERVVVSPFKYTGCYTVDRSLHVSSSPLKLNPKRSGKRDHIKGRLDFGDSNVQTCTGEPVTAVSTSANVDDMADFFDIDIPNLDVFGSDFSLSELLVDFDLANEGMGLPSQQSVPSQQPIDSSIDIMARPECCSANEVLITDQASSEPPASCTTAILSEKDLSRQGPDSLISVKSITKCIKIVSPAKIRRSTSYK